MARTTLGAALLSAADFNKMSKISVRRRIRGRLLMLQDNGRCRHQRAGRPRWLLCRAVGEPPSGDGSPSEALRPDGTRTSAGTSTSGPSGTDTRKSIRAKIDALIEESAMLLRPDGVGCDPAAAAVRAGQAAAMIRKASPGSLSDVSDVSEQIDEVKRLLLGVEDTQRLAEVWSEKRVPPRGYGDAPDDVREATARSLFEEVDVKMMEIFSDASGKEDAFLLITPAEYMQLVHRAEAALKYTKDPNLVEQVEMLVGAILDMKEAVTEVDTADAGGPGEEEAEEEEEALSAVQRIEAAASLVSEADSLFEICDIEGAIVKAKEAADLAVEGSKEWEEALLILGQGYQRVQNDVESSKVFQILRDRGLSKKNRQLAAQLQAIAEAPELAMKTENISSISMLPKNAYMGSEPPKYKKPKGAKPSASEILVTKQNKQAEELFKNKFLVVCGVATCLYVAIWSTSL